ncbi:MAG: hypothetical protein MJE63_22765, partial [Proteobacteria bacterium]|nr:hypothetical protein [Pseudomonadota bacterium]
MAGKKQAMGFYEMAGGSDDLIGEIESTEEKPVKRQAPEKPRELAQSVIRDLIEKSEILINSIPATPDFLKGLKYREPKKKWFNFRKKEESEQVKSMIANCRHSLNSYIERRSNDPRK